MGAGPIHSYKTSVVPGTGMGTPSGKAGTAPSSGTAAPGADSYLDQLEALGNAKLGKKAAPIESPSGDPVADLLNTLDQLNQQGIPQGGNVPFAKISAESALSKFPDSPEDVLSKFNSIIGILEKKLSDIDAALAIGNATPQQVQAAQKLKSDLESLLSFYKIQRDKVAALIPKMTEDWNQEVKEFLELGGTKSPESFDSNDDGWIGKPEAPGSYRIGVRTFDKKYIDPVAKKMVEVAKAAGVTLNLKCEFKKDETQSWAINPASNLRVAFDPVSGKVIGENTAKPGYVADIGVGFSGENQTGIVPDEDGVISLKAKKTTNSKNFAEAGLELHTPEYIYVEVDSDGELVTDDLGHVKPASFELKDGRLVQTTPPADGETTYKQIYVKEMSVSSEDGDIVVALKGGDDNSKILGLRITGPSGKKATDVALAITSGEGASHRDTPIILDAGSYQSTCKEGIQNEKFFKDLFSKYGKENPDLNNPQIQDTLKHFMGGSGDSLLSRGIAFKTQGHITGTDGNDLMVVEEPASHLTLDDPAYKTVFEGAAGNNALFAGKGSLFANGLTLVSKDSGDAADEIAIGINPYGLTKGNTGNLKSSKGMASNKLYIHVNAAQSEGVAIQSAVDGTNAPKDATPEDDGAWLAGDDYYDIHAKVVATNAFDGNTGMAFDPDFQAHIQGKMTSASTDDFSSGSAIFSDAITAITDGVKKKATDAAEDWAIEGAELDWMKGKYYKADKNTLDSFFADFKASKLNEVDPFAQLDEGIAFASGEDE